MFNKKNLFIQQVQVFDYLECLLDGLRMLGGDRIRLPERRRFDPDEPCMFRID
jgi:hypothetical protein